MAAIFLAIASLPLTWVSLNGHEVTSGEMAGTLITHKFTGLSGAVHSVPNYWFVVLTALASFVLIIEQASFFEIPKILSRIFPFAAMLAMVIATLNPYLHQGCSAGLGILACLVAAAIPVWVTVGSIRLTHQDIAG